MRKQQRAIRRRRGLRARKYLLNLLCNPDIPIPDVEGKKSLWEESVEWLSTSKRAIIFETQKNRSHI
jgi:hypothetical protein